MQLAYDGAEDIQPGAVSLNSHRNKSMEYNQGSAQLWRRAGNLKFTCLVVQEAEDKISSGYVLLTSANKKNTTAANARLLFIVDNDFGALGVVMYFLHRQPLIAGTTILLPSKAYELHGKLLPAAVQAYRSLQDILDVIEKEPPDLVFLFSGYLFTLKAPSLFTFKEFDVLLSELRRRGCAIATSDPFLGTLRHIKKDPVNSMTLSQRARHLIQSYRDQRSIRRVEDSLKSILHILPVPRSNIGTSGTDYISFFNPMYIRDNVKVHRTSSAGHGLSEKGSKSPSWIFVLAQFDLEFQQNKHGEQKFIDIIVGKLRETLDNNRLPTLIAPAEFVAEVSRNFDSDSKVKLLPACCFEDFERHLLDAEIAFYWQFFSTSTFLRLIHGLPVFFFDPGHLASINKAFLETALTHYFLGDPPIQLDIEEPLQADQLAKFNKDFLSSAQASFQKLSRLPTPIDMIEKILGRT